MSETEKENQRLRSNLNLVRRQRDAGLTERDEAQAWAAWFAAERDEVIEELEASQRAHILAVRAHSESLKVDKARYDEAIAERDYLRAVLDQARKLANTISAFDGVPDHG